MYERVFVFAPVVLVYLPPDAGDMMLQQRAGAFTGSLQFSQSSGVATIWPKWKPGDFHDLSRKPASFAVTRNCGIGSSSLNAEVKAFDRLRRVRGSNSGIGRPVSAQFGGNGRSTLKTQACSLWLARIAASSRLCIACEEVAEAVASRSDRAVT